MGRVGQSTSARPLLTLVESHSHFWDKLLGIRLRVSPKRECGPKGLKTQVVALSRSRCHSSSHPLTRATIRLAPTQKILRSLLAWRALDLTKNTKITKNGRFENMYRRLNSMSNPIWLTGTVVENEYYCAAQMGIQEERYIPTSKYILSCTATTTIHGGPME